MQTSLNWLSDRKQFEGGDNRTLFLNNKLLFLLFFLFENLRGGKSGLGLAPPCSRKPA